MCIGLPLITEPRWDAAPLPAAVFIQGMPDFSDIEKDSPSDLAKGDQSIGLQRLEPAKLGLERGVGKRISKHSFNLLPPKS